MIRVQKIISGGQTGADRGGLDAAIALGIPHGGWCPKGRRAEDGVIPDIYQLRETASTGYETRTRANVADSDGTVIFVGEARLSGGSGLTAKIARSVPRPFIVVMDDHRLPTLMPALRNWLLAWPIRTLNVAGSRESKERGIQAHVRDFLIAALRGE